MCSDYLEWDEYYRKHLLKELGWELGKPRPVLVEYVENGLIKKGKTLDTCCGAGTNSVYLARSGFDVTGIDISLTAIGIAKKKAAQAKVNINFLAESFIDLSFRDAVFNLVFDMGCFHHVEIEDRLKFIKGVFRILKKGGVYMLTCFSYMNGPAWNHFTMVQITDLFSDFFELGEIRHYASREGNGYIRFFNTVLMSKKPQTT
ncbi:MAG: class I SAM-dependent methyltransferase [Candidatus Bathyarchaeia archaeon]